MNLFLLAYHAVIHEKKKEVILPIRLAGVELERIPSTLLTSQKYSPVSLYNTDGML